MYIKYIFLFCVLLGCTLADDNISTTKISDAPSLNNVTNDTNKKTTPKPAPSTSTPAPSTSTPAPSTSTPAPTSSTSAPTTVTSTPLPSTTTSIPTTPIISTTASPSQSDVWSITNSTSNITCIVAKMDILLEIYEGNKNGTLKANPKTVNAKGVCGEQIQTLEIVWSQYNDSSLIFSFNETEKKYFISSLQMNILLNNISVHETEAFNLYETGKNTSYSCPLYEKDFNINNKTTVKLTMNNIQFEAFRLTNSTKFSSAHYCPNSDVPDIVPLIVGLVLAGLVIVVVIGYFIGRRRSQARGYLSM